MNRIQASEEANSIAEAARKAHEVLATTEDFEVLKLPQGELDHMVLLLFQLGKDFSQTDMPRDVVIPVNLDGRLGYLWEEKAAMRFAASKIN